MHVARVTHVSNLMFRRVGGHHDLGLKECRSRHHDCDQVAFVIEHGYLTFGRGVEFNALTLAQSSNRRRVDANLFEFIDESYGRAKHRTTFVEREPECLKCPGVVHLMGAARFTP